MSHARALPLEGLAGPELLSSLPSQENVRQHQIFLSVLTPVYNERHLVAASLARVLGLKSCLISKLELIIVDDCSTDGTWELLRQIAAADPRVRLYRHARNEGKGAALRTAISHATGDVCIVHDADMEYNPADIPSLLVPFIEEGADAVFGSRYLAAPYRRVLTHRHTRINRFITRLSNWFTDLDLSDLETGYKAIKTPLLKSIPIRSNDFRFEVEITFKLAKRRARVFEVPIRYLPRTYEEGKKIRAKDGILAILAMIRQWIIDDLYQKDQYGSNVLVDFRSARRFNTWLGDTLRPYIGDRVLEIRAGIGSLTSQFIPRDLYVASDENQDYLRYLKSYSIGKPYLRVLELDALKSDEFLRLQEQFDTVLMINVLEHLSDPQVALQNTHSALVAGGRAVILVPHNRDLYGTLDEAIDHQQRYSRDQLRECMEKAGFEIETIFDFNRTSAPGWYLNGKILKRTHFSPIQMKILELLMPVIRSTDRIWPWPGISLIAIGKRDRGAQWEWDRPLPPRRVRPAVKKTAANIRTPNKKRRGR
jgi:glycosyltransferase involved in cell wall biosynthesis